jgi:hypothetical protein
VEYNWKSESKPARCNYRWYHQSFQKSTGDIPARLWKKAVEEFPPTLPSNMEDIEMLLREETERTITPVEIFLCGYQYNNDYLTTAGASRWVRRTLNGRNFGFADKVHSSG